MYGADLSIANRCLGKSFQSWKLVLYLKFDELGIGGKLLFREEKNQD